MLYCGFVYSVWYGMLHFQKCILFCNLKHFCFILTVTSHFIIAFFSKTISFWTPYKVDQFFNIVRYSMDGKMILDQMAVVWRGFHWVSYVKMKDFCAFYPLNWPLLWTICTLFKTLIKKPFFTLALIYYLLIKLSSKSKIQVSNNTHPLFLL